MLGKWNLLSFRLEMGFRKFSFCLAAVRCVTCCIPSFPSVCSPFPFLGHILPQILKQDPSQKPGFCSDAASAALASNPVFEIYFFLIIIPLPWQAFFTLPGILPSSYSSATPDLSYLPFLNHPLELNPDITPPPPGSLT